MRVLEAKNSLVQQTAGQAALENAPFSDLEKRMMYFTETGECPEDLIALNRAFEAEYETAGYEKKISLLMAKAYRRIRREGGEKLRLWNEAFRVLSRGDHYILLFWRPVRKSPRMWSIYALVVLAAAGIYLLALFFFGVKGGRGRGGPAPVDKYIPVLSPLAQHTLQLLFLLALVFAIFPKLFAKLVGLLPRRLQSTSSGRRQK